MPAPLARLLLADAVRKVVPSLGRSARSRGVARARWLSGPAASTHESNASPGIGEDQLSGGRRADAQIIVMCSEGYASTLAAATLRRIGLREATDLDGGFQAWKAAGLPTRPAQPPG
jgi:rhodanese-related sulfurtransferase